jgi:hypothetical protein
MICDFCSAPEIQWKLPARTFNGGPPVDGLQIRSVEHWAACDICCSLVLSEDWEKLARRTAVTFKDAHPDAALIISEENVYQHAIRLHEDFRYNRTGDPEYVLPHLRSPGVATPPTVEFGP